MGVGGVGELFSFCRMLSNKQGFFSFCQNEQYKAFLAFAKTSNYRPLKLLALSSLARHFQSQPFTMIVSSFPFSRQRNAKSNLRKLRRQVPPTAQLPLPTGPDPQRGQALAYRAHSLMAS